MTSATESLFGHLTVEQDEWLDRLNKCIVEAQDWCIRYARNGGAGEQLGALDQSLHALVRARDEALHGFLAERECGWCHRSLGRNARPNKRYCSVTCRVYAGRATKAAA